jgi:hypothetical protein
MSNSFEDLVRKHVKAEREQQTENEESIAARKQWWQLEVKNLFDEMEKWLESLIQDHLIYFRRQEKSISEEPLGTYGIQSAIISLGKSNVSLEPVGTIIFGSFGRIDVNGPQGSVILRLQAEQATPETRFRPTGPVWYIVNKDQQAGPVRQLIQLNKSSFTDLLSDLVGIGG